KQSESEAREKYENEQRANKGDLQEFNIKLDLLKDKDIIESICRSEQYGISGREWLRKRIRQV
ncbi:MAG: hypothetical protein HUJ63_00940, partial [Enterococcus sp.]|nr:hypothetical protein [Enterococcus sp.]